LSFFEQLHRSIVDPPFYKEILAASKGFIVRFLLQLLLLTAFLTSVSQVYYMIDEQRGITKRLEAAFPGTEIVDGKLLTSLPTPYVPPAYLILPVLDLLFGVPSVFDNDTDSMLILDTSAVSGYSMKVPAIVMKSENMIVFLNAETSVSVPYKQVLLGNNNLKFTSEHIKAFILKNLFGFLILCFFSNLAQSTFMLVFSISFLAIAAYLFRVERERGIGHYIRAACFAVSPICVGSIMIGLSGVKLYWTWHILIFISTIVMFRAVVATGNNSNKSGDLL
jgi:hypothetical protein